MNNNTQEQATNILFYTNQCQLECQYCVSGDTQISMTDNTTKTIKDIVIGDKIISIDENENNKKNYKGMKLKEGIVTKLFEPRYVEKLYHIITEDGNELYITGEHPILTNRKKWKSIDWIINSKEESIVYNIDLPIYNNIDFINTEQYMIGYMVACWLGDGGFKKYTYERIKKTGNKTKYIDTQYSCRFVVKDDNIMNFFKKCLDYFEYEYTEYPFKISNKYNIIQNAVSCRKEITYDKIIDLIESNLNINTDENYYRGFLAGIYDCEGCFSDYTIKIYNSNDEIIEQIETALKYFNLEYIIKEHEQYVNKIVRTIRLYNGSRNKFLETVYPQCEYKRICWQGYSLNNRTKIKSIEEINYNDYVYNIETDTHTYIANNILVHNCYEQQRMNLSEPFMAKFEDFKDNIDKLALNDYANCLVIFGGEPTLAIDAIYDTINYTNTNYPNKFTYYMNTNGIKFSDENVFNKFKDFYNKGNNNIIITFSYDGSANFRRKFKDGSDSTEYVLKAINLFNDNNLPFNISYCLNFFNYDVCIKDFIYILLKWKNIERLVISPNWSELDKKFDCYDIDKLYNIVDNDLNTKCKYLFSKFKKPICDRVCDLCGICNKIGNRNYITPNKEIVHTDDKVNKFDMF